MTKALIVWGGWDGHQPDLVAGIFDAMLTGAGIATTTADSLDAFDDPALGRYDLIVPIWTKGEISRETATNISEAVARGTGLAGCHGGMCDAFRDSPLWQFMTGANWVAHPGGDGVTHRVQITAPDDPLVADIPDFDVASEQYYLHTDPANRVLATTKTDVITWYHSPNGPVDMPVAWTRHWGFGRVYYNALGHQADVIAQGPAHEMLRRGLLWAAAGKAEARGDITRFHTSGNHW